MKFDGGSIGYLQFRSWVSAPNHWDVTDQILEFSLLFICKILIT